jgi:hypothetical protein
MIIVERLTPSQTYVRTPPTPEEWSDLTSGQLELILRIRVPTRGGPEARRYGPSDADSGPFPPFRRSTSSFCHTPGPTLFLPE